MKAAKRAPMTRPKAIPAPSELTFRENQPVRFCRLASGLRLSSRRRGDAVPVPGEDVGPLLGHAALAGAGDEEIQAFKLHRPAALLRPAPDVWTFWPNGTCEPAEIAFDGAAGTWLVNYDPLTARATFLKSEVK